ncbi:MAG: hypothetical protein QY316_00765 [Thermodesulfobacteriota bacterium]|nr:MAG: hypothetical protein QY316_00765 [Thermodesulfobacteriota bacterium]
MYICLCKGITTSAVRSVCRPDMSADELASCLGIDKDGCCGKCVRNIQSIAELASGAQAGV